MKRVLRILPVFLLLVCNIQAQSVEEAKKLYLERKYSEAMPAFEKAIKTSPNNPSYNQWYGTCLLETGHPDNAEKYLRFAASKNIQEAYRSLGKLYFLQYRFDESLEAYEEYTDILVKKKLNSDAESVKPLMDQSKTAARMLENCENIQIIDSVIVDKNDFIKCYILSKEAGSLQSSNGTIIYENELKDKRYYAKPDINNLYSLFSQSKLQDNWADEVKLSLAKDSLENDNYPFALSDGVTIYYASSGHESIGGYDIFRTRYNLENDTYLVPEQLGMPFNSIYNDYMMAIDELNNIGYFATDRYQPNGKIVVYTFIPNEERVVVSSDDQVALRNRAQITSIKDSWKANTDYASLLNKVHSDIKTSYQEKKKDFSFVINDNLIYDSIKDFENETAKDLFVQSQSLKEQINNLEKELDTKRLAYSKASSAEKQTMSTSIISDENKLEGLYDSYNSLVIKTRNTEIKYLRQQQ